MAPYYRQYAVEKRRIAQAQFQEKTQRARLTAEQILEQKRKYNEFYLKKWQYYRQIEEIRRNKEFLEYRKVKTCAFIIKMHKAKSIAKLVYDNFVKLVKYKQDVVFRNMKVT